MTTLQLTRNGSPIDGSTILRNVEIIFGGGYGLDGSGGEPSSATFQLVNVTNTYDVTVGDRIQISAILDDDTVVPRFTGRVYSRRVDFENIDQTILTVAATGHLAQLERLTWRDPDFQPSATLYEELDEDRIATLLYQASSQGPAGMVPVDWPNDSSYIESGGNITFPETLVYAGQSIGELCRVYALNALGLMVDTPDGHIGYYNRYHARNVDPVLELDASTVLAGLSVENSADALINLVRVFYGIPDGNGERESVEAKDEASIITYGVQQSDIDSQLLLSGDALDVANEWVYRNSRPRENFPAVSFTDELIPDGFLSVGVGEVVSVTGLPAPLAGTIVGVITGYREAWDFDNSWQIDLEIIDGRYWGRGIIWDDVPSGDTWATISTIWTWDTMTEYNTTGFTTDRWKDCPANNTWAKLDATITSWDNWSN